MNYHNLTGGDDNHTQLVLSRYSTMHEKEGFSKYLLYLNGGVLWQ